MADNVTILDASGNPIVMRTKVNAGVQTQVMKMDIGGASAELLISSANPLPSVLDPASVTFAVLQDGAGNTLPVGTGHVLLIIPQSSDNHPVASVALSGSGFSNVLTGKALGSFLVDKSGNAIGSTSATGDVGLRVEPVDSTNTALFSAANPGGVAPQTGYSEVIASAAASGSTTIIASQDAIAYRTISVQVRTNDSTDTVTWQCSNDNSVWVGFCLTKSSDTGAALVTTAAATTGIWSGTLPGRYFKLIRNATASNITVTAELKQ